MLNVQHIGKVIKDKTILSDVSFEIKSGECVALIGPNGAGKSTLLSCLLGDKKVTSGQVQIDGKSPKSPDNKAKVAVLLQENVIPKQLKVSELITLFQTIYSDSLSDREIDSLLNFTPEQKRQHAEKLSGGQRRLLSVVLCLIGKPSLLFLDEPTAGMDTSTRRRFWEIIDDLKVKGTTIIYSSHYIEEVEHTADRILVLHKGHLLRDTTPYAMRHHEKTKQVTLPLCYRDTISPYLPDEAILEGTDYLQFQTEDITPIWHALTEAGCTIEEIEIQQKTLLNSLFDTIREDEK